MEWRKGVVGCLLVCCGEVGAVAQAESMACDAIGEPWQVMGESDFLAIKWASEGVAEMKTIEVRCVERGRAVGREVRIWRCLNAGKCSTGNRKRGG